MTSSPIFVTGCSRSGTTLMQGLIGLSPDTTGAAYECSYLRHLVAAVHEADALWEHHTFGYFDTRDDLFEFHTTLIEAYLAHVRGRFGEKRVVQKEPSLTYYLPELARLLPTARFVVMLRDIRDVAASWIRRARRNGTDASPAKLAADTLDQFERFHRRLYEHRARFAGRLVIVRYERLCLDPSTVCAGLAEFLDIDLPGDIASRSWKAVRTPSAESATELDGTPVSSSRIGAFGEVLPQSVAAALVEKRALLLAETGMDLHHDEADRRLLLYL